MFRPYYLFKVRGAWNKGHLLTGSVVEKMLRTPSLNSLTGLKLRPSLDKINSRQGRNQGGQTGNFPTGNFQKYVCLLGTPSSYNPFGSAKISAGCGLRPCPRYCDINHMTSPIIMRLSSYSLFHAVILHPAKILRVFYKVVGTQKHWERVETSIKHGLKLCSSIFFKNVCRCLHLRWNQASFVSYDA